MELITEKPLWFIVFCLLAGFVYAFALYRNDKGIEGQSIWLVRLLASLRFLVVSVLCFLLLSPLIKTITNQVEKPLIVIAQDNSSSVVMGKDSSFYKNEYKQKLKNLSDALSKDYEVRYYSFGENPKDNPEIDFSEKQTNISQLFDNLDVQYNYRNLGAVILASDGLYNAGRTPLYAPEVLNVPFYTIAMGDTTVFKDLIITQVINNKTAVLGNSFPIEISIEARQCAGQRPMLSVKQDSSLIYNKELPIAGNKFRTTITVYADAKSKGVHQFEIQLQTLSGEVSDANNKRIVFIDIIEAKEKVLILADSPHPDLGAMKNAIEVSRNYDAKIEYANSFTGNFADYELVILHQLPSFDNKMEALSEKLKTADVSVMYVLGAQTDANTFNKMQGVLNIGSANGKTNATQANFNNSFSLFTVSDNDWKYIQNLPPLTSPFGVYKSTANNYVMYRQRLGNISTDQPLFLFNQTGEKKIAVLAGEGIWRWRIKEFEERSTQLITDDFLQKAVQYLCVKDKREPFKVKWKNNYYENEPIKMEAELYNKSGELINAPDIKLSVFNSDGKAFDYNFSKTEKAYSISLGNYPVGKYSFKALAKNGEEQLSKTGSFTVSPLQVEAIETIADHQLMNLIAEKSGGKMIYPQQVETLKDIIKARKEITSVSYEQKQLKDLINLKWVFFLLFLFLAIEWFLRKRVGTY